MMHFRNRFSASLLLLMLLNPVLASDFAKEQRWADQVVDSLLDGEAVWLEADSHRFLSIFTPAEDESREKALIIFIWNGVRK